jgi:hypothetical protein
VSDRYSRHAGGDSAAISGSCRAIATHRYRCI